MLKNFSHQNSDLIPFSYIVSIFNISYPFILSKLFIFLYNFPQSSGYCIYKPTIATTKFLPTNSSVSPYTANNQREQHLSEWWRGLVTLRCGKSRYQKKIATTVTGRSATGRFAFLSSCFNRFPTPPHRVHQPQN